MDVSFGVESILDAIAGRTGPDADAEAREFETVIRLLKTCFNRLLSRVTDGPTKSCTFLCACHIYQIWGSAAKTTPMSFKTWASDVEKGMEAFFNFSVRTGDCEGSSGGKPLPNQRQANETLVAVRNHLIDVEPAGQARRLHLR
jgi:hypothetical protein